ncbi:MAG: hypothetical protein ACYS0E_09380 [Planctomycetota bacterium]|jgi:hypothetical protein
MRPLLLFLLLAGCMSMTKDAAIADPLRLQGAWFGLDDSGATWWRLELSEGRRGRGGFETDGAVARYEITNWSGDAQGKVRIDMVRGKDATALDRAPPSIRFTGRGDGTRLRLTLGKTEIELLREEQFLAAHDRLKKRMAEPEVRQR